MIDGGNWSKDVENEEKLIKANYSSLKEYDKNQLSDRSEFENLFSLHYVAIVDVVVDIVFVFKKRNSAVFLFHFKTTIIKSF